MSTVIEEGDSMKLFGATFVFSKDTQIPESVRCGRPLLREEVYPRELDDLLHLLSAISSVSGGAYLLAEAMEANGSRLSAQDLDTLASLTSSVELLRSVIFEKFRRRA